MCFFRGRTTKVWVTSLLFFSGSKPLQKHYFVCVSALREAAKNIKNSADFMVSPRLEIIWVKIGGGAAVIGRDK